MSVVLTTTDALRVPRGSNNLIQSEVMCFVSVALLLLVRHLGKWPIVAQSRRLRTVLGLYYFEECPTMLQLEPTISRR